MSYCRFTEGDVYAYVCDGGVQFYVSDGRRKLDRLCNTFSEAYQYARALRDIYELDVPSYAIEELKADALEEAARICGSGSAVAELEAENTKLRELVRDWYELAVGGADSITDWNHAQADLEQRMRELGVEVDGG